MNPTALVIGDTHFKNSVKGTTYTDSLDFIQRVTEIAKKKKPSFIVLLGDILDSHKIQVHSHKLAEKLIGNLSSISPTYILIGNHDFINNSQFLTDNHIFTPFKKWKNVFIADTTPLVLEIQTKMFIFCPYTPPGRFIEALDKLTEHGHTWDFADCIFAHQEFKGAANGRVLSTKGDEWEEDFPIVISGHIHEASQVGKNIFYTGSSTQTNFGESSDKKIWYVKWTEEEDSTFTVDKISINGVQKKSLTTSVQNFNEIIKDTKTLKDLQTHPYKITITGTSEEIKTFKKSKVCKKFSDNSSGIVFDYELNQEECDAFAECASVGTEMSTYREVFHTIIQSLSVEAHKEYESLFGRTIEIASADAQQDCLQEGPIELEFEGY